MVLLIVDDNPTMRRLIGKIVADLVDDIRECSDGAEALFAYSQWHPDLTLMDIEMQQMDGLSATREIIAVDPEAKIVIVSRHGDEPFRVAAREAGACGYVLKENLIDLRQLLGAAT
jgi:two-component system chemotaxis response regulator CheY